MVSRSGAVALAGSLSLIAGAGAVLGLPRRGRADRKVNRVDTLREEVLNSQSVRSDLLKYKLFVVGGIGAAGLGLAGATVKGNLDLVLASIPLACLYIDLLCRHLSLRILVIGTFMRERGEDPLAAYEDYAERARELRAGRFGNRSAFALENWAVSGSTAVLSAAVLIYGIVAIGDKPWWFCWTLMLSGGAGIVITFVAELFIYRPRSRLVRALPRESVADAAGS